jgi:hypothetical protein
VPFGPTAPLHPEVPEAVQFVAFTDDQVMEVEVPAGIELAASVSVGAAGTRLVPTVKVALLAFDSPAELAHASV